MVIVMEQATYVMENYEKKAPFAGILGNDGSFNSALGALYCDVVVLVNLHFHSCGNGNGSSTDS